MMKNTMYTLLLTSLVASSVFAKQVTFQNKTSKTLGAPSFTITVNQPDSAQINAQPQSITIPSMLGGNSINIDKNSNVTITALLNGTPLKLGKKKKQIQRSGKNHKFKQ